MSDPTAPSAAVSWQRATDYPSRWLILPAVLVTVPFMLSVAGMVVLSLFESGQPGVYANPTLTLENYWRLASDPLYRDVIVLSVRISLVVTILCLLLAYPLALTLVRTRRRSLRRSIVLAIALPFLTGALIKLFAWRAILGNQGVISEFLQALGLSDSPVSLMGTEVGVSLGLTYLVLPYALLPLVTVMSRLDRGLEEAAMTLGANEFSAWRRVTLPLSLPGVGAAAVISFALAMSSFTAPLILGNGAVKMITNILVEQLTVTLNFPFAAAIAITVIGISLGIAAVYGRLLRRPGES